MRTIGGFLELDLLPKKEFHSHLISTNSGRNALKLLLKKGSFSKVYLPILTCNAVTQVLDELHIAYEFYTIDKEFLPVFSYSSLGNNDLFIINNYWGLLDEKLDNITPNIKNCLIDNAQAFYYRTPDNTYSIYSPRKFFGVADGGYLKTPKHIKIIEPLKTQKAFFEHLIKPIEEGSESAYSLYQENENRISRFPIKKMSKLSKLILNSIDYELIKTKRRSNYLYLYKKLQHYNKLDIILTENSVPLAFPFLTENGSNLRNYLTSNKIFTPLLWPNVLEWSKDSSFEFNITNNTVNIPIDQRYSINDLDHIINYILNFFNHE